jgi:hypothetical protein
MDLLLGLVFFFGVIWVFATVVEGFSARTQARQIEARAKITLEGAARREAESKAREEQVVQRNAELDWREKALSIMAEQKSIGFPWLADAYDDYYRLEGLRREQALRDKTRPAPKAADEIREINQLRRTAEREARLLRYQIAYYESLFPDLADYKDEGVDEEIIRLRSGGDKEDDPEDDPASKWLSKEEYESLPRAEKFQRALDHYWTSRRDSAWKAGRDYERYIGYRYEKNNWQVEYCGIERGLDDLGRDLITTSPDFDQIQVVQCKRWAKERTIHEKHIFQLFATTLAYKIDLGLPELSDIKAVFITSASLSERALLFAKKLGVLVKQNLPLEPYPCIKCNISQKDGTKIYHLPFDQQYDRTTINKLSGEFYAATVQEAETAGFRRAFRHHGLNAPT